MVKILCVSIFGDEEDKCSSMWRLLDEQDVRYVNFLIDLDAPLIWHDCSFVSQQNYVHCDDDLCSQVQSTYANYNNMSCPVTTKNPLISDWGYCGCSANMANLVTGACESGLLNYDYFALNASTGRNTKGDIMSQISPIGACAKSSSFNSFPKNVIGVMPLSSSPSSILSNTYKYNSKKVIALCLPSTTSAPGVLFTGIGPYNFTPKSSLDVSTLLSYTPLIKHPDSFGYFINIDAIVIKNRSISVPNATTKISTMEPYTKLRSDIYKQVVRRFSKVTRRIPTAKPVAPFNLCYYVPSNSSVNVPDIGFRVEGGRIWSISTANSMKQVTRDTACLAFVDGGAKSEPAIVIGTFQLEDVLVVFNLENSTFGFGSSLLNIKSSCSKFNFTQVASDETAF
ncbi:chitinase CLP-like [Rutidosis leptorrhynchoides]|uniref:chitinase CLP-like n=1 Tax=Rutidosis leptorrhynchoides TaxID=125765 RepID=UPI003A9A01AE